MKKILSLFFFASILLHASAQQEFHSDIRLSNYEYPFEVHFLKLEIQRESYEMAYMDAQPEKSNGKCVLLFHGKNFNGAYWEKTARALLEEGYRVIMPDQIGFGKSSKPEHLQYSFAQLALNTKQLLDSLKISKTAVLGHSMGGMLATRFALDYPDYTEKLILENPIGLEDYASFYPYVPVDYWYRKELKTSYASIKKYQLESYYDGNWKPEYDEWAQLLASWTDAKDYSRVAWNNALTYDMILTQPVCYEFDQLKVPVLLIIGTRDRTFLGKNFLTEEQKGRVGRYDKLGKATQSKIKGAQLVEIPDTGHLPHIESFDSFIKALLDFL